MRSEIQNLIHIGIRGTAIALDRRTGAEIWRTPLKGSCFVNLVLDGEDLFATAQGEIFCLDPMTGHILWNNPLRGMGWGLVAIASNIAAPLVEESHRREESSNGGADAAVT